MRDGKAAFFTGGENRPRIFTCLGPKEPWDGAERLHWRGTLCGQLPGSPRKRLRVLVAWCLGLLGETAEVPALMKTKFLPDPQPIPTTTGQDDFERARGTQEIACAQPMVSKSWFLVASGFTLWLGSPPSPDCFGCTRVNS